MHLVSERCYFHIEIWAENNNPKHRPTRFAISIFFSAKFIVTPKDPSNGCLENYGQRSRSHLADMVKYHNNQTHNTNCHNTQFDGIPN